MAGDLSVGATAATSSGRLARNVSALLGAQLVTWSMTLAWTLVVPRALGPAGTGVIVSALSVTGVLAVLLGLGTRNYLVRELVVAPADGARLVATALALRTLCIPAFLLAVALFARFAHETRTETTVLYLVGAAALLTLLAEPLQAWFQAVERMQYLAYSDVLSKSAQAVVGVCLVLAGVRVLGVAASMAGVAVAVLVVNTYWLRSHLRPSRATWAELREMARASVAYWAFGLFFVFYLWIDTVMLSLMTRPEVVGWYGVPTRLFQTAMFLPTVVSTAWLPRLVSAYGEGPGALHRAARRPLAIVATLSAPICTLMVMLAGPLVRGLFGPAYGHAVPVLIVLGFCIPPMYLNIVLSQVLVAAKRQASWTWVMAGATVVNPVLNLALISATERHEGNGAIGAALSLLVTEVLIVVAGVRLVGARVLGGATLRRPVLAVGASAGMWGAAEVVRSGGPVVSLAVGIATFGVLAGSLRLVRPDDVRAAARLLGGRLGLQPIRKVVDARDA